MGDKEDYLTLYRVFFENFAATVNPEDQLPVHIAGYTITESELPGEVLYWTTQYLTEKQCPLTLMTPLRRIILDEVRVASKLSPVEFGYKSDDSVYIALRLMQAVTARVNAICLRYLDNSQLDTLPPPPPPALLDMKTVSCATKNSRRAMEDRHVEIGNLEALFGIQSDERTSFYAVYDGHAGSAAATYCAAHLHQYLAESPYFTTDLPRAMREAFIKTDDEFVGKSNQERACGGSTAVVVVVRGHRLLAAWAGDSLALLAKRMRLLQLVRPHKPSREDERHRIEKCGGTVMFWGTWRVNGQLAVSRAIGDAQYKPCVTAQPDTTTVDLDGDEDFVVVACDGLWDFVSEDDVALAVYRQLADDPDDLKAVTKCLIAQAKRQGSCDNISIIVVFLKDPRDIAADNQPPMDLGLDNGLAMASPPPFSMDAEVCKLPTEARVDVDVDADNGVEHSDSDSDDLGPETAVDADDVDADPAATHPPHPTPPADDMEEGQIDGALVDNVAESGEESEDEWNYYKGEGDRDEQNPSEEPDDAPRSETPCQDTSAWESSSVDMNSSPLNPDAPVFVPGSVAGSDVLLAESPRKPLPMDDIELPDVAQFQTEAVVRPAELLDLDNCDQLNGHHNVSLDEVKEHLNGNSKFNMDSLGFGFNVGSETDKLTDKNLIQDFERIQKDTTDFCNIQVFQTKTETNPFSLDDNDEFLERLKNKERDPMSMSFYQEKDDDTCERLKNNSHVDLNAVQPLPDSDDDDLQQNGVSDNLSENEKENISPDEQVDFLAEDMEPNNDIIRFDDRKDVLPNNTALNFGQGENFMEYTISSSNNQQDFSNIEFESNNAEQDTVAHTDTPESHKLLFEQIPEIPDGKSSELGFTTDDLLEQTESEKDSRIPTPQDETSQDVDMDSKNDSPSQEEPELISKDDNTEQILEDDRSNELVPETEAEINNQLDSQISPLPVEDRLTEVISPEVTHNTESNVAVDVHQSAGQNIEFNLKVSVPDNDINENDVDQGIQSDLITETPDIKIDADDFISDAEITEVCSRPTESPLPAESPLPTQSPLPVEVTPISSSPAPADLAVTEEHVSAMSTELPIESPLPSESPAKSPQPSQFLTKSPLPSESHTESPLPHESPVRSAEPVDLPTRSPIPPETVIESLLPEESLEHPKSPIDSPLVPQTAASLTSSELSHVDKITEFSASPAPDALSSSHVFAPSESPLPEIQAVSNEVLTPEPAEAALQQRLADAPAPDIVPESRVELVTDIDIGIPESHAQEICVPVTSEIQADEGGPVPAAAPLAAAAVAAVATATATAALATKKTPTAKKAPTTTTAKTTPKVASKTTAAPSPRTPASAAKKPATPARTTATPAKPASASKTSSAPRPAAPKPAPITRPPAKTASKETAPAATKAAPAKVPAPRPATARPASAKAAAPAAPRTAPAAPRATSAAARPAPPGSARPTAAPRAAPRPAAPAARAPAAPKPKPDLKPKLPEKKPLTNGDVKPAVRAPPAPRAALRPAPAARAAPPNKSATQRAAPKPLDKQSKDVANKRITSRTAPPRTAPVKNGPTSVPKSVPKPAKAAAADSALPDVIA